jgi:copper transport protein
MEALRFRFGRIATARVALLAAAARLTGRLRGGVRRGQWLSAAAAVGVALFETVVLLGHDGRDPLAVGSRFVHALGVSLWLGGLVMLVAVVLPRRRTEELAEVLPRFSKLATGAVALVVVGGVALAIRLAGVRALATTAYGWTLAVKVALVVCVLLVAGDARRRVRRRVMEPSGGTSEIVALVGVELALIAAVLAATAVLLAQTPPR